MMKTFMQEAATCGADDDEDSENLVRENEISSAVRENRIVVHGRFWSVE